MYFAEKPIIYIHAERYEKNQFNGFQDFSGFV